MTQTRSPSLVVVLLLVAVAPLMACVIVHIGHAPSLASVDVSLSAARAVEPAASEPARRSLLQRIEARQPAASEVKP